MLQILVFTQTDAIAFVQLAMGCCKIKGKSLAAADVCANLKVLWEGDVHKL